MEIVMLEADELRRLCAAWWGSLPITDDQRTQLLEISEMFKLQTPRSTELLHEVGDEECGAQSAGEQSHGASLHNPASQPLGEINECMYPTYPDRPDRFKVLTWNACAISFPLHIHPVKFGVGLLFGCWWHDWQCDVPMQLDQNQARFARQAEYIRQSGADLVLLQEVLSTSMLQGLMRHLEDFDHCYLKSSPKPAARLLWMTFLAIVALLQCLLIQLPLYVIRGTATESTWLWFSFCWMVLAAILALRWWNSVAAHFLLGDVAGQLVALRRKDCKALAGPEFGAAGFDMYNTVFRFEGREKHPSDTWESSIETSSWLSVFYHVRPRGVLRVTVPLTLAGRTAVLTVLNTHMPHNCDNSDLLHSLGRRSADLAMQGTLVNTSAVLAVRSILNRR